ncbi:MAG: TonB-dependent receptor, partial [Deltaproteobacteria bacterium]|nr:TonB-dependent receptor [Nannocystaceae bacterium]
PGAAIGRVPPRKRGKSSAEPAWSVQSTTDDDGRFTLAGVPDGRTRVVVLTPGYERLEIVADVPRGRALDVTYYQTRLATNPYRTEVVAEADSVSGDPGRTLTAEETAKIPGTNGDALKSVQNFPGVARSSFGIGRLSIRGAAPGDSAIYLADHEIPVLFHFGGITSVFNADLLQDIELLPGNFDARFGDAIGGIVDVTPRRGRRDGFHGYIDADIFDAGALAEGPVGKGSIAASVRRSYIDAILPAVLPDDAGIGIAVAPRYWDYQLLFDHPLGGGNFTARVFGSDDQSRLVLSSANDVDAESDARTAIGSETWFHRADLAYRKQWDRWSFMVTPSYRRDSNRFAFLGEYDSAIVNDRFSNRAEATVALGKRSSLRFGTELIFDWEQAEITAVPVGVESTSSRGGRGPAGAFANAPLTTRNQRFMARPALYATAKWGITEKFSLHPGFRLTYYANTSDAVTFEPRLRAVALATPNTTVTAAIGIHNQQPTRPENDPVFGNPDLQPERALHSSLGVEQRFGAGWSVGVTAFHKHLWKLASASPDLESDGQGGLRPELFDNAGVGRVFGGELLLRKDLTRNLYGWVAYTVSKSEIRQRPGDDFQLFDFDQTHILTLIASYRLPRGWQVGSRFRVVSGEPITARSRGVTQLYDGDQFPLEGPWNGGGRQRAFHQLDLRVDKVWTLRRIRINAYLDIQNLYNAKNPEFTIYSWNFRKQSALNSLPIIPSLGLKLEW